MDKKVRKCLWGKGTIVLLITEDVVAGRIHVDNSAVRAGHQDHVPRYFKNSAVLVFGQRQFLGALGNQALQILIQKQQFIAHALQGLFVFRYLLVDFPDTLEK